jgi:hypothetical protein
MELSFSELLGAFFGAGFIMSFEIPAFGSDEGLNSGDGPAESMEIVSEDEGLNGSPRPPLDILMSLFAGRCIAGGGITCFGSARFGAGFLTNFGAIVILFLAARAYLFLSTVTLL